MAILYTVILGFCQMQETLNAEGGTELNLNSRLLSKKGLDQIDAIRVKANAGGSSDGPTTNCESW